MRAATVLSLPSSGVSAGNGSAGPLGLVPRTPASTSGAWGELTVVTSHSGRARPGLGLRNVDVNSSDCRYSRDGIQQLGPVRLPEIVTLNPN